MRECLCTVTDVRVDEFSFLPAEAESVGFAGVFPPVERVALTGEVSAIRLGSGPARAVFIHGAALNAHTWDATILSLYGRVRAAAASAADAGEGAGADPSFLALDLPGHGESPWRSDADYTPGRIAGPVAEALSAAVAAGFLDKGFTIVGHSLGGLIGIELSAQAFAGFRQLVLVDILPLPPEAARVVASFLDGPRVFESRDEIVQRALSFGFGGDQASLERGVFHNTRILEDGRVIWKHHLGTLGPEGFPTMHAGPLWDLIGSAPQQLDLIAATQSFIDEAAFNRFVALQPGARALRLEGGHNLQEDSPAGLAAILADLIFGVRPTGAVPR